MPKSKPTQQASASTSGVGPAMNNTELSDVLIQCSLDGILAFDRECRYTLWNPAMERITGRRADEVLGKVAFEIFPFLVDMDRKQHFEAAIEGQSTLATERLCAIPETGKQGYLESHYTPLRDKEGLVVGGMVIVRDVTQAKQAAIALADANEALLSANEQIQQEILRATKELSELNATLNQQNQRLSNEQLFQENLFENMPAALAYRTCDGRYPLINTGFASLFGTTVEAFKGKRFDEVVPERIKGQFQDFHAHAELGEPYSAYGHPYIHTDQTGTHTKYLDYSLSPVHDIDGRVLGMVIVGFDVSARITLEQELEAERADREDFHRQQIDKLQALDRLKGDFLNAASHELRTPLTSIEGYAEFLEDQIGGTLTPAQQDFVKRIQEGTKRLKYIVEDLLDFARLEAGTFQLTPQLAELTTLLADEVALLRPQAEDAQIKIAVDAPQDPLEISIDPLRIGQVLRNLLGNAIKFTPPSGVVELVLKPIPHGVRIEVKDTGIGISPANIPRLFQKFYQVDTSTTRSRGGAGLGLSISKSLVEAHGGRMGVESTLGLGSTFWFTLPLEPPRQLL
jgi:PAS domain S-box-containing protein